jgi:hypothetical protein
MDSWKGVTLLARPTLDMLAPYETTWHSGYILAPTITRRRVRTAVWVALLCALILGIAIGINWISQQPWSVGGPGGSETFWCTGGQHLHYVTHDHGDSWRVWCK